MMIDLNRIDSRKLIDIAAIIRTGLYAINPMQKHFGIQLTDEVNIIISENRKTEYVIEFIIVFLLCLRRDWIISKPR